MLHQHRDGGFFQYAPGGAAEHAFALNLPWP